MSNKSSKKIKKSSYKGFNYPLKGKVTRVDDPLNLKRIQVCIPSYHGDVEDDKKGSGTELGSYPWAQMCSVIFKDTSAAGTIKNVFSSLFGDGETSTVPIVYPEIGDIVWLAFEGGDIRCPIYIGSLAAEVNGVTGALGMAGGMLAGGSLGAIAAEIVYGNESSGAYNTINCNDNGALSIGLIQWHGENARTLMKAIKEANPESFKSIETKYGVTINLNSSWSNWTLTKGTSHYNAISDILNTEAGKKVQNDKSVEYMNSYINTAKDCGVTDNKALIYYCDMSTQYPAEAKKIAKATNPKDLDTMHNTTLNGGYWLGGTKYNNNERRKKTYNKIKEYDAAGKLTIVEGADLGGQLLFPCPGYTTVSSPFGPRTHPVKGGASSHGGVDLCGGNMLNAPIIASHAGSAQALENPGGYGNYVMVSTTTNDGKSLKTVYAHMNKHAFSGTKQVQAGEVIGYAGTTGCSTGVHLHFEVRINDTKVDPMPYIKGGN